MSKDILVFVESVNGTARKASYELLSKANEIGANLGGKTLAVVLGRGIDAVAEALKPYADTVLVVDNDKLAEYRWDTYASALSELVKRYAPALVLGGSTVTGKDLFPRLAARFRLAVVSDATDMHYRDGKIRIKKPLYGGKILSWVECNDDSSIFVTFRPNSFAVDKADRGGEVRAEEVDIVVDTRLVTVSTEKATSKKVDLQESDFIICGGRGMNGPDGFQALEEIADLMKGRVGASRAAVDSKWREYEEQIGKSGKTVSPKLYIACGISGALHHTMGMDTSQIIVAINKDPKAPIFQCADYGIVDDMFNILPVLKEELRKVREEA